MSSQEELKITFSFKNPTGGPGPAQKLDRNFSSNFSSVQHYRRSHQLESGNLAATFRPQVGGNLLNITTAVIRGKVAIGTLPPKSSADESALWFYEQHLS